MSRRPGLLRGTFCTAGVIFLIAPLLAILPASLTSTDYPVFPPSGLTLRWYAELLERPEFVNAFVTSVKFATAAALISTALATVAGIAIAKYNLPGRVALVSLLTAPLTVPQLVLGTALLTLFVPIGIAGSPLALLMSHVVICVPFSLRFVLTGMSGFDYTLERAGQVLGAHPVRVFWRVTLPVIRPAIVAGTVFSFLISFDNVTMSLFMISPNMTTLPLEVFFHMQDSYDTLVASVSGAIVLLSLVLIVILEKVYGVGRLFSGNSVD